VGNLWLVSFFPLYFCSVFTPLFDADSILFLFTSLYLHIVMFSSLRPLQIVLYSPPFSLHFVFLFFLVLPRRSSFSIPVGTLAANHWRSGPFDSDRVARYSSVARSGLITRDVLLM
jgi:hypothetical protein